MEQWPSKLRDVIGRAKHTTQESVAGLEAMYLYVKKPLCIKPLVPKSVQADVSVSDISRTKHRMGMNSSMQCHDVLPVEDVVELKNVIEHYATMHGLP